MNNIGYKYFNKKERTLIESIRAKISNSDNRTEDENIPMLRKKLTEVGNSMGKSIDKCTMAELKDYKYYVLSNIIKYNRPINSMDSMLIEIIEQKIEDMLISDINNMPKNGKKLNMDVDKNENNTIDNDKNIWKIGDI